MSYPIYLLKNRLEELKESKSPNKELKIAELELAISILKEEADQFNKYLES